MTPRCACSRPPTNISDGGASAYCVYAGKYPAGATAADVKQTEDTAVGEVSAKLEPIKLAGADSARWAPSAKSGGPEFAVLVVRRAKLVFVLGIPAHQAAKDRLTRLGALVLARLAS